MIFGAVVKRPDGVLLRVRLTPKSAKEEIVGIEKQSDGKSYIKAVVRAVPEKGLANKALEALTAKALGVAKRDVRVASGSKSRYKSVMVSGDPVALFDRITNLLDRASRT